MAALAQVYSKLFTRGTQPPAEAEQNDITLREQAIPLAVPLRAFANEDIYFHIKPIDNSRVVRQADPAAERAAWSMISSAGVAAALLVAALLPAGYSILAGYQLEKLRHEKESLAAESVSLKVEASKIMTPERMEKLAQEQQFADPTIVYLEPAEDDSSVAANQAPSAIQNSNR